MSKVYVIRDQHGHYATKKGEWVSGRDAALVAHFVHRDQAVNQVFELGLRSIDFRGRIVETVLQENGKPLITEYGPEPVEAAQELASLPECQPESV